ncbi:hypothetical protein AVO44_20490 [Ruegeria profundi]|uniref:Uncharacterized protein n=1 Tax=Ruegeria profundi TaxID=1685378 RepID=A0A0X3T6G2_9RHOB|nr:hypothetical protein AVO44_20490 [Ruegeria profundi]
MAGDQESPLPASTQLLLARPCNLIEFVFGDFLDRPTLGNVDFSLITNYLNYFETSLISDTIDFQNLNK